MSLIVHEHSHFTRLVINRPESANALDKAFADELDKHLIRLEKNPPLFVIIESNYNEKNRVFCSGGDLKGYAKLKTKQQGQLINGKMKKNLQRLRKLESLVIAIVDGLCIGGGCEMVAACDFVWATGRARFRFGQIRVGLTPGWGGGQFLLERVSRSRSLEWLATGRPIEVEEALRSGLVDEIIPQTFLIDEKLGDFKMAPEVLRKLKSALKGPSEEQGAFEKLWWSKQHLAKLESFRQK